MIFKTLKFEISGSCNAKCPYCSTGNKSNPKIGEKSKMVTLEEFTSTMNHLEKIELIKPGITVIYPYNWGEPLLNANVVDILNYIGDKGYSYCLSTNASFVPASIEYLRNLPDILVVSMPGFSQKSYGKIHGFKFETILKNIETLRKFSKKMSISFHIYQFNLDEIRMAKNYFTFKRNVNFGMYYAVFCDFNQAKRYLKDEMSYCELKNSSKDLILGYVKDRIDNRPSDYSCEEFERLVIDEHGNYITCCTLGRNDECYKYGKVGELSKDEVVYLKKKQAVCEECLALGMSYWWHNWEHPKIFSQTNRYLRGTLSVVNLARQKTTKLMNFLLAGRPYE